MNFEINEEKFLELVNLSDSEICTYFESVGISAGLGFSLLDEAERNYVHHHFKINIELNKNEFNSELKKISEISDNILLMVDSCFSTKGFIINHKSSRVEYPTYIYTNGAWAYKQAKYLIVK